jgi:hypothetical protein
MQGPAAGHQLARLCFSPAALMVGYPRRTGGVGFYEIDRATELNAAIEADCTGHRRWIGPTMLVSMSETEGQLEMPRHLARRILARQPQPFA